MTGPPNSSASGASIVPPGGPSILVDGAELCGEVKTFNPGQDNKATGTKVLDLVGSWRKVTASIMDLVGGLEHFLFSHIFGILMIPIDFHIFQRGRLNHQPVFI